MGDEEQNILNMNGSRSFPGITDGTPQSVGDRGISLDDGDDDEDDDEFEEQEAAKMLPTPEQGGALNQIIITACEEVAALKVERKSINAEIQAVIESIEAKGIPRAAFKICISNMEMTEDQRAAYDLGVLITRGAVGLPVQTDLFGGIKAA